MIDKGDWRIPYSASLMPGFRFIEKELKYAGMCSPVRRSQYYEGSCDLRVFGLDALLHMHYRRGNRDSKLEIIDAGEKSIDDMGQIIASVFDVDPSNLFAMRLDFAADMYEVPVTQLFNSLRVKFKQSSNVHGEREYETVGRRRLEYFRYGKGQNSLRVYDKPAECLARLPGIQKKANRDAEPPTFAEVFGFPQNTVMTRIECQAGGRSVPKETATFRQLYRADELNPFPDIEIIPQSFSLPDPRRYGVARSLSIAGIHQYVQHFGLQTARAMLNEGGNAARLMKDFAEYQKDTETSRRLTVEKVVESYRSSVRKQINGNVWKPGLR